MPDKTVLYPASGEEIDALNGRKVLGMARKVDFPGPYLLEDEGLQAKNSPVQNLAYSELLDITPMGITEVEGTDGQTRRLIEPQDSAFPTLCQSLRCWIGHPAADNVERKEG